MTDSILVLDGLIAEPDTYRAGALALPFGDVPAGDQVFHGMALITASPLSFMLQSYLGLTTTFEAFRLSPEGQQEPNFIHADWGMGDWSGVLFLNPAPPAGDGTTFHRNRATGAIASSAETDAEKLAEQPMWADPAQWEPWRTVAAAFNRIVLFPSRYFHSRALPMNWGAGLDARLVQILFGTGSLPGEVR